MDTCSALPAKASPAPTTVPPVTWSWCCTSSLTMYSPRHGDDLLAQARISYRQAVCGDSVELPTITGETVVLKVPAGTQPGERLRVRNQGLPMMDGYGRGNLVVQIQVQVPRKIDGEQTELLQKFDEIEQRKTGKTRKKGIFDKVKDMFH